MHVKVAKEPKTSIISGVPRKLNWSVDIHKWILFIHTFQSMILFITKVDYPTFKVLVINISLDVSDRNHSYEKSNLK